MSQAAGQPRGLSVTDSVELGRGRLSSTDLTLARHVSSNAPPSQFFPCAVLWMPHNLKYAQSWLFSAMTLKAQGTRGNREMMECWKHFGKFARQGARSRGICMSAAAHDTPGNTTTAAASTCIFQIGKIDLLLWSNTMIDLAYYYNTGGSGPSCAFWSSWSSLADPDHQLRVAGCSSLILILILIFLCILIIDCRLQLPDPDLDPDHKLLVVVPCTDPFETASYLFPRRDPFSIGGEF